MSVCAQPTSSSPVRKPQRLQKHLVQSQCHSPVGEIKKKKKELSLDDVAKPPEPSRLTCARNAASYPGEQAPFLLEGPGCSESFQYQSENAKRLESNTIWKALGGSHYLRTCPREETATLISEGTGATPVGRNYSPTSRAELGSCPAGPSSRIVFPLKRLKRQP